MKPTAPWNPPWLPPQTLVQPRPSLGIKLPMPRSSPGESFVQPPRVAPIAKLEYGSGGLFIYFATIVNGAGGAGDHTYIVTAGVGNELEILGGVILNGDTSSRTVTVKTDTGVADENVDGSLPEGTALGAGTRMGLYRGDASVNAPQAFGRMVLSGSLRLVVRVAAVTASENSAFGFIARLRGGIPTIAETGASTPTITIEEERTI